MRTVQLTFSKTSDFSLKLIYFFMASKIMTKIIFLKLVWQDNSSRFNRDRALINCASYELLVCCTYNFINNLAYAQKIWNNVWQQQQYSAQAIVQCRRSSMIFYVFKMFINILFKNLIYRHQLHNYRVDDNNLYSFLKYQKYNSAILLFCLHLFLKSIEPFPEPLFYKLLIKIITGKFYYFFLLSKMFLMILVCLMAIGANSQTNLIQNGDFEAVVSLFNDSAYTEICPYQWACSRTQHVGALLVPIILFGRFIDLRDDFNDGYISQTVSIANPSACVLSYYLASYASFGGVSDCALQISLNDVPLQMKLTPADISNLYGTYESLNMSVSAGNNTLKFADVINSSCYGSLLDNVSLICAPEPANKKLLVPMQIIKILSIFLSVPISCLQGFNSFYLMLSDLWMYNYTLNEYQGMINNVFFTVNEIENLKLEAFSIFLNYYPNTSMLQISNYSNFTEPNLGTDDSILIEATLTFIIFYVPQTLAFCLLFYGIFKIAKQYPRIRKFFQQYYFLKEVIIFSVLEQNLTYFSFVSFANLRMAFSFKFIDKLSLLFTILMLFCFIIFAMTFFFMMTIYRRNWVKEFTNGFTHSFLGHSIVTIKNTFRSLLRGFVFFYLRNMLVVQMTVLALVDFLTLLLIILFNRAKKPVLKSKISFCLLLCYHFLFTAFNISIILEQILKQQVKNIPEVEKIYLQLETIVLVLIGSFVIFTMIFGFIPSKWLKVEKPDQSKQNDNRQRGKLVRQTQQKANDSQQFQEKTQQKKGAAEREIEKPRKSKAQQCKKREALKIQKVIKIMGEEVEIEEEAGIKFVNKKKNLKTKTCTKQNRKFDIKITLKQDTNLEQKLGTKYGTRQVTNMKKGSQKKKTKY